MTLIWRRHGNQNDSAEKNMALAAIIRAANRQNKSLDLSRKDLDQCPSLIGQLTKIEEIKLTNNRLTDLPKEMCLLNKVRTS